MRGLLSQNEYDFISENNKDFIIAFDAEMERLGYTSGKTIGPGHCWGRYMIIYTKAGVKSKKSYARFYIREEDMVLRLYLSDVDKHRDVIEQAPVFIHDAFTGPFPSCDHCHGKTECIHQKKYTLNGTKYEICDGKAFWFFQPELEHLSDYLKLFNAFYPAKKVK